MNKNNKDFMEELNELAKSCGYESIDDFMNNSDDSMATKIMFVNTFKCMDKLMSLLDKVHRKEISEEAFTKACLEPLIKIEMCCQYFSVIDLFDALPKLKSRLKEDFDKNIKPNLNKENFKVDSKEVQ